jgi:hypothetical protein
MSTRAEPNGRGVGAAAKGVADHASTLARLEVELATVELKHKAQSLGLGIGLGAGAAVVAVYAIGFLLAAAAAGLATFLPVWLSILIVGGLLVLTTLVLALLARRAIKRGVPVPEAAITEAKATTAALRGNDADV